MYRRIRDLRQDNDRSQTETAKLLHMQPTVYARYERGERDIPLAIAIAIAKLYDVSLDYIAGLIDRPRPLYPEKDQKKHG